MKKLATMTAAVAMLALPYAAGAATIGNVEVEALRAPACRAPLLAPYSVAAEVHVVQGNSQVTNAGRHITDLYRGDPPLRATTPFYTVVGQRLLPGEMWFKADTPDQDFFVYLGTLDPNDHIGFFDANMVRIAVVSGDQLLNALTGGRQVFGLNVHFHLPVPAALVHPWASAGPNNAPPFEFGNMAFGAPSCGK